MTQGKSSLNEKWDKVQIQLEQVDTVYAVLFLNRKIAYNERTRTLEIIFDADSIFSYTAAQKPKIQSVLSGAIHDVFGSDTKYCLVKEGCVEAIA